MDGFTITIHHDPRGDKPNTVQVETGNAVGTSLRVSCSVEPIREEVLKEVEMQLRLLGDDLPAYPPCEHVICYGPGHQSTSACVNKGPHSLHHYPGPYEDFYWTDADEEVPSWSEDGRAYAFSGIMDESPRDEDGEKSN